MELEREMIREERAAAAGLLSPDQEIQKQNDHHGAVGTSLSVPGNDSALRNQNSSRRGSFKISRRRTLSCGSSLKRKNSYRRSGSVDHRIPDKGDAPNLSSSLASTKDGRSAPAIIDKDGFRKEGTRRPSLRMRRNSSLEPNSQAAQRKRSVDFADTTCKNFLGVLNFDMHKKNHLTVPSQGSNNNLLKVPEIDVDGRSLLQVPCIDMGSNPLLCIYNHDNLTLSIDGTLTSPDDSNIPSPTRPGNLTLKECYSPPKKEMGAKSSSKLLPLMKPLISEANGLLTSVEVHYADSSNPGSSTDLHDPYNSGVNKESSELLHIDKDGLNDFNSQDSFFSDKKAYGESSFQSLFDNSTQKQHRQLSLSETLKSSVTCLQKQPSTPKSDLLSTGDILQEGAVAMQNEEKSNLLCSSKNQLHLKAEETNLYHGLKNKDSIAEIEHNFQGLVLSSECLDENEDHADSMTELISDSDREEAVGNSRPSINSPGSLNISQKVSRQNSEPTPDEDLNQNRPSSSKGSGSVLSFCRSSSSSRKPSSGKARSPTTPTWLNLRTPLARIESFHSNDFECFMDSDNDGSLSPTSVTTPTVPCFAYKFHVMKKKQTKLKTSNGSNKHRGCGSVHNNEYLSSKISRNSVDKKHASMNSGHARYVERVSSQILISVSFETNFSSSCN